MARGQGRAWAWWRWAKGSRENGDMCNIDNNKNKVKKEDRKWKKSHWQKQTVKAVAQPTIKLVQILKGKNRMSVCDYNNNLSQGSPTPGPSGPVRNWSSEGGELHLLARQEVSGRWASEASSVLTASPHHSHYCLSSVSYQISGGIRFSKEHEPYCELCMRGI